MRHEIWLNAVMFQLAWAGFVGGAVIGYPTLGIVPLAIMGLVSLRAGLWRSDLSCMLLAAGAGAYLERLWIELGTLQYADTGVPWWIVGLWIAVALTLNHSLAWIAPRPWLGAALAAMAAPLSYGAGAKLGAVTIGGGLAFISVAWALVFFALFTFARSQQFTMKELNQ
jgi:hypothetical protein